MDGNEDIADVVLRDIVSKLCTQSDFSRGVGFGENISLPQKRTTY